MPPQMIMILTLRGKTPLPGGLTHAVVKGVEVPNEMDEFFRLARWDGTPVSLYPRMDWELVSCQSVQVD
jgi:hypothetical protein